MIISEKPKVSSCARKILIQLNMANIPCSLLFKESFFNLKIIYKNFQGWLYYLVIKCALLLSLSQLDYVIITINCCQVIFCIFFDFFEVQTEKEGFEPSHRY